MSSNSHFREFVRKRLFAEDLVFFILSRFTLNTSSYYTVDEYRPYVANSFTFTVQQALFYITRESEEKICRFYLRLEERGMVTLRDFENFVSHYSAQCFESGFEASVFLNFCARVAYLAAIYFDQGVSDAPWKAIEGITKAMEFDLSRGGWDTLNHTAKRYADEDSILNLTAESDVSSDEFDEDFDLDW